MMQGWQKRLAQQSLQNVPSSPLRPRSSVRTDSSIPADTSPQRSELEKVTHRASPQVREGVPSCMVVH